MSDSQLPIEISVAETQRLLGEPQENIFLLDCREPSEHAFAQIDSSNLIPMSEFSQRLSELEPYRDARVIVYCHHGIRSLQVANFLRGDGFVRAQSMRGGIDTWSLEIDQAVRRY